MGVFICTRSPMVSADEQKKLAARQAIDNEAKSGMRIGVGSGSTVVYAVERLGELYKEGTLKGIVCVPTSFQARQLINQHKLPLGDLENYPELDIDFDGADAIDDQLNLIKGGGGACVQEKLWRSVLIAWSFWLMNPKKPQNWEKIGAKVCLWKSSLWVMCPPSDKLRKNSVWRQSFVWRRRKR